MLRLAAYQWSLPTKRFAFGGCDPVVVARAVKAIVGRAREALAREEMLACANNNNGGNAGPASEARVSELTALVLELHSVAGVGTSLAEYEQSLRFWARVVHSRAMLLSVPEGGEGAVEGLEEFVDCDELNCDDHQTFMDCDEGPAQERGGPTPPHEARASSLVKMWDEAGDDA